LSAFRSRLIRRSKPSEGRGRCVRTVRHDAHGVGGDLLRRALGGEGEHVGPAVVWISHVVLVSPPWCGGTSVRKTQQLQLREVRDRREESVWRSAPDERLASPRPSSGPGGIRWTNGCVWRLVARTNSLKPPAPPHEGSGGPHSLADPNPNPRKHTSRLSLHGKTADAADNNLIRWVTMSEGRTSLQASEHHSIQRLRALLDAAVHERPAHPHRRAPKNTRACGVQRQPSVPRQQAPRRHVLLCIASVLLQRILHRGGPRWQLRVPHHHLSNAPCTEHLKQQPNAFCPIRPHLPHNANLDVQGQGETRVPETVE